MQRVSPITAVAERGWKEYEMHEFLCGHQECGSRLTASNRDDLMRQVKQHLQETHNLDRATDALLSYLESTCVTTR